MTPLLTLVVVTLGGVGAATRFVVDGSVRSALTTRGRGPLVLPLGTVAVNVSGSLLIGLVAGAHLYLGLPTSWQLAAATGFCGGYTTFSAAMVESVRLAQDGRWAAAAGNALGTLLLTVLAAAAGIALMAAVGS